MIGRRLFLAGVGASVAGGVASGPEPAAPGPVVPPRPPDPARPESRLDRLMASIPPRLEIVCPQSGEEWSGWYYDAAAGRYDRGALESLEWFFRDWRESIRVRMCVRLYWSLSAALSEAGRDGPARIELLSGYRTPRTNAALPGAARDSMHMYGRAADFRIPGFDMDRLVRVMEALQVGGVGRYPGRNFVHVDTGRLRRWTVGG